MSRLLTFLSASHFFGLTPQYRIQLFSQVHEITFYGNGGFDYYTVYNMPIWLRNFTFKKIQEHYQKEKEAYDKTNKKGTTVVDRQGLFQKSSDSPKSGPKRVTY
jgi:hypothetical protein